MTSREKGEYAQLMVQQRALTLGVIVSKPTYDCRYDFVLDVKGRLYRAQVKYAAGKCTTAGGVVSVQLARRTHPHYTRQEIDVLLVYVPSMERVLWIEPSVFEGRSRLYLRIHPTRNGQQKKCLMAEQLVW